MSAVFKDNWLRYVSLLWLIACIVAFNNLAYEIEQFNADVRVFLRTGRPDSRFVNADGLPATIDARTRRELVSPFYVVHYGLVHSQDRPTGSKFVGVHWEQDPSLSLWDAPPGILSWKKFLSYSQWVVKNVRVLYGQAHLVYDFDWAYNNYPSGGLKAPWWSGLTDGYAILLMLRAFDATGDRQYLEAASNLYRSVLAPVSQGGSLLEIEGDPWIEEYVDPTASAEDMSRVLNGMIYAYRGIKAYESWALITDGHAEKLRLAIVNNVARFKKGRWSYYDLLGNAANIKYHRIHVSLLSEDQFRNGIPDSLLEDWRTGSSNPGLFWMLESNWSWAQFHFLLTFLICAAGGPAVLALLGKSLRKLQPGIRL